MPLTPCEAKRIAGFRRLFTPFSANYLLLRNGEFGLSLIREFDRLKSSSKALIREQDLHLALLRASMGTTAQHDPLLSRLRFSLPSGPLRPLLPVPSQNASSTEFAVFDDLLLGTPLILNYTVSWPLDLFLHPQDLRVYGALFGYLSALRKTHTRIHTCWTSLSNSQRARRRWTGLGEGGTTEDLESRRELLRCGWGLVRELNWFLDSLLAYTMVDVVDVEWRRLKMLLAGTDPEAQASTGHRSRTGTADTATGSGSSHHLDFTTLRTIHHDYLERIIVGTLLSNQPLTAIIRSLIQLCDQFVAQVERWGGDVLPELLIEGSINDAENERVGDMVRERLAAVFEINQASPSLILSLFSALLISLAQTLHDLLQSFYEQLTLSTSQQPFVANADASKSMLINMSAANISGFHTFIKRRRGRGDGEVRRHVERLLLRLDFSGEFSRPRKRRHAEEQIPVGNVE
jgi:gamma-tubulin complex component 4